MSTPRRILPFALAASVAASLLAAPTPARAEWDPIMHRSDAGADLYLWSARRVGASLAAVPFVQFEATPDLFINLRFPVALSIDGYDDRSRLGLGNPTFSLFYSDAGPRLTWYVGGRVSLPMGLVDDYDWRYANGSAAAAMALYDPYLWATDTIPFGGLGGIEYRFARFFVLRAGGDLTLFPGLRGRGRYLNYYRNNDLDAELQARVEPEFQSRSGAGGGVSLTSVWVPTVNGDNAQISAMPYFVYDSQKTFFMRVGALIALDRPLGPGFDDGNVASLYLQFGGHID